MSDTPRTDAEAGEAVFTETGCAADVVNANFARQLERELSAEKRRADEAESALWRVAPNTFTIRAEGDNRPVDAFEGSGETFQAAYEREKLRAEHARQATIAECAAVADRIAHGAGVVEEQWNDKEAGMYAQGARDAQLAVERLKSLPPSHTVVPVDWLREAADDVADWGAYAGEYFQQKHGYEDDINKWKQRYEAAMKGAERE